MALRRLTGKDSMLTTWQVEELERLRRGQQGAWEPVALPAPEPPGPPDEPEPPDEDPAGSHVIIIEMV